MTESLNLLGRLTETHGHTGFCSVFKVKMKMTLSLWSESSKGHRRFIAGPSSSHFIPLTLIFNLIPTLTLTVTLFKLLGGWRGHIMEPCVTSLAVVF